jgi:hypothetical protein
LTVFKCEAVNAQPSLIGNFSIKNYLSVHEQHVQCFTATQCETASTLVKKASPLAFGDKGRLKHVFHEDEVTRWE